jgi:hypothetical protein
MRHRKEKGKMLRKRSLVTIALAGLGILLLVVSFRTFAAPAPATPDEEDEVLSIAAQDTLSETIHLPLVFYSEYKEITHQDDFEDWDSGWPWGDPDFHYGYKLDSDGSNVYHIRMNDEDDRVFVTGPVKTLRNFEYNIYLRRETDKQPLYWGDEYGILISPTPIDPENPSGTSVYTFQIELWINSGSDTYYSVTKWDDLSLGTRTVLARGPEDEYLTDLPKFWNLLKIVRTGNTLEFYLTRLEGTNLRPWQLVHTRTDNTLPDELYIGFYASHASDDLGTYTIEFQFDNLYLFAYQ